MPVDRARRIDFLKRIHLFRSYDDEKLGQIADLLEEVQFPANSIIYAKDGDPEFFYFIYSGQVRLLRDLPGEPQPEVIGTLEDEDFFGIEVLETNWPNQISVVTESDCTLLRLSVVAFKEVLDIVPSLSKPLQLILDSYRLSLSVHFNWLEPNEMIFYVARRHVVFMALKILPPLMAIVIFIPLIIFFAVTTGLFPILVLLGIAAVLLFGWLAWAYVDWTNDYYVATNKRVVYQERVILLYDSRQEAPLDAIQSSSTNTTQVGRLFGYGNVVIRTLYGTVLFKQIAYPEQVKALLEDQQFHAQVYQRWKELGEIKKRLDDRFSTGRPKLPLPPKGPAQPPPKPDPMRQFLSTLLHLRYEVSGTVIFRTHWIILLKKIWAPLLIILGLLGLFLLAAYNRFALLPLQSTCGVTGLAGLIVSGWLLYQYVDWHNDIYMITQEQVADINRKPLGREEKRSAPLNKIQNIEYKRLGLLGLLLNYGTVYIQVGDQKLTFDDVFKPADVQRELFHNLSKRQQKDREIQQEADRQRVEDWIYIYNGMINKPPEAPPPRKARGGF
jgi:hypothetical protein